MVRSIKALAVLLPAVVLLSACTSAPAGVTRASCAVRTSAEQAARDWFVANAMPLKSLTPGGDFADLQPLKQALDGARLVRLGEGTHGTHEFSTIRHRRLSSW